MTRHSKLAAAVFGDDTKPNTPEWKRIQDEEAERRQALLATQRTARLAREAALASATTADPATPTMPSRRRKQG